MARYGIAFDLSPKAMTGAGLSASDITQIYPEEIPQALAECGFTAHPQGFLYHTVTDDSHIRVLMQLKAALRALAPNFCRYAKRVCVFRMDEWSDVTDLITADPASDLCDPDVGSPTCLRG